MTKSELIVINKLQNRFNIYRLRSNGQITYLCALDEVGVCSTNGRVFEFERNNSANAQIRPHSNQVTAKINATMKK